MNSCWYQKLARGCPVFQNTIKGPIPKGQTGTQRIPWPTSACATLPARHWAGERMKGKPVQRVKWGRERNEGQSSFSCASNSTLEPVPALTTSKCCSHAIPPSVPWLQVRGATCTWYTFKPRMAYRVWIGSLSQSVHIYMKLTYIYLQNDRETHLI